MDPSSPEQRSDEGCSFGTLGGRIACILSYDQNLFHSGINYVLVLVNLIYCVRLLDQFLALREASELQRRTTQQLAFSALTFVIFFQVGLCLMVHCMGISIIWCAMSGWGMSERRRVVALVDPTISSREEVNDDDASTTPQSSIPEPSYSPPFTAVTVLNVGAIVYYAITEEFLTTIAHICALILGAVISKVGIRIQDGPSASSGSNRFRLLSMSMSREEDEEEEDENEGNTSSQLLRT